MPTVSRTQPSWGLVLVRLSVGAIFLVAGWSRVAAGSSPLFLEQARDQFPGAPVILVWLSENIVLRFPETFASLIAWGELLGGAALVMGALVRPAGFLLAGLALSAYFVGSPENAGFALLLGLCCTACAMSRAGRRMGMDAAIDEWFPTWMTWIKPKRGKFDFI